MDLSRGPLACHKILVSITLVASLEFCSLPVLICCPSSYELYLHCSETVSKAHFDGFPPKFCFMFLKYALLFFFLGLIQNRLSFISFYQIPKVFTREPYHCGLTYTDNKKMLEFSNCKLETL